MSLRPEQDIMIRQFANALTRRGLREIALVTLQAGRPLSFLGGQLIWVAQPALSIVFPSQKLAQVAHLLEEPAAVQSLIACLQTEEA